MQTSSRFSRAAVWLAVVGLVWAGSLQAQDDATPKPDKVVLQDGTTVVGKVLTMSGGSLEVETKSAGTVKVKWADIVSIESNQTLPVKLTDGSQVNASFSTGADGKLQLVSDDVAGGIPVDPAKVDGINVPEKPTTTYRGNVNAGATVLDGNTQTKSGSLLADFEMRTERQRLTLGANYNYAEDSDGLIARNARARMKYDFFVTERFFLFVSAFVENDAFQDLNLRTSLGAGPGYQFIQAGDFEDEWFKDLELYGEIGLSFFDEDFKRGMDASYVSAIWHAELNWPLFERLAFFHRHWIYPGLEDLKDLYVLTETGLRFNIWANFIATLQVDYRWDNTPSAGLERDDTTYLATLGYAFTF